VNLVVSRFLLFIMNGGGAGGAGSKSRDENLWDMRNISMVGWGMVSDRSFLADVGLKITGSSPTYMVP